MVLASSVVAESLIAAPRNRLCADPQPEHLGADKMADPRHEHDIQKRGREDDMPHLLKLSDAELQAEREHQEDHADLAEHLDAALVDHQRTAEGVLADHSTGQDIADDLGPARAREERRHRARRRQDHRQILDERRCVH